MDEFVDIAMREWEEMNRPGPSEDATVDDFDRFAWDTDRIAEVLIGAWNLENGDLVEEVAKNIYSSLPGDYCNGLISDWMQSDRVKRDYDNYMNERGV